MESRWEAPDPPKAKRSECLAHSLPQQREAKTHKAQTSSIKSDLRAISRAVNAHKSAQIRASWMHRVIALESALSRQAVAQSSQATRHWRQESTQTRRSFSMRSVEPSINFCPPEKTRLPFEELPMRHTIYRSKDELWTYDVIADYLGVERKVILRLACRRLIPAIRISRKIIRFDLHSVRRELAKLEIQGRRPHD
jgi:hypothetical protein